MRRPPLSPKLAGLGTTIFAEMSALAVETGAINLGQGFPDEDGPMEVAEAAIAAIRGGVNQYPPGPGIGELRIAIANHQARFWGMAVDPGTEVLVTAGATEAIAATVLALCDPGDEIIAFEPTYDSYTAVAAMAGARLRPVTLTPPSYDADIDALEALVTERTRLVLLNTPHNPTGKVFTVPELEAIARVCVEHDLIAVTDEVYEHLVFDGEHRPLATFPGMAERTLTISSAGKTFSFTGWKIGWVCGSEELVTAVRTAKQFITYVNGAPFQPAIAVGLGLGDDFYAQLAKTLLHKRDVLCDGLQAAGFDVFVPQGTYFATVDIRSVGGDDGLVFCRELPKRCGVVADPELRLLRRPSTGRHLVRFAFCKRTDVLTEAAQRLALLAR